MNLNLVPCHPDLSELLLNWRKQKSTLAHNPLIQLSNEKLKSRLSLEGNDLSKVYETKSFRWFVEYKDQLVANVSLKTINSMMKTAEIGYGVDEKLQGIGIGSSSVKLLIDKVFKETDLRRLYAYVHDQNIPSCKLLERLGLSKEGVLKEHFLINQSPANEVIYGILRRDWCLE